MKKHLVLLSMIAALAVTGCNFNPAPSGDDSSDDVSESSNDIASDSSAQAQGHVHTFDRAWRTNETHHWHACTGKLEDGSACTEKGSYAEHTWDDGTVVTKPGATTPGQMKYMCTVCKRTKFETIDPTGEGGVENENFTIYTPEDTSMLTKNCKKYIDDMRAQEKTLANKYKYDDLYGTNGVNIDEGSKADSQRQYLDTGTVNGKNQTVNGSIPDRSDKSMGVRIDFVPSDSLKNKTYTISYSTNQDMSGAITKTTTSTSYVLRNLFVNQKYYVSVSAEGKSSEILSFTTGDYPRWILARSLEGAEDGRGIYNVRDMGGYMTYSGQRVKQGLVFRGGEITTMTSSGHYNTITEVARTAFREDMGMVGGIELDLRGTGDITDNYNACAFAKNGDIGFQRYAIKSYEQTFTQTRSYVAPIFELLKNANNKPVYYHCHGGADRTGTIGFLLNGLLGVSYTDLVIDFELTSYSSINNEHIRCHIPGYQHNYDRWPKLIQQLQEDTTGGYAWNGNALLKDNIYNFLNKACSVPTATLDTIRNIMLEPAQQNKITKNKVRTSDLFLMTSTMRLAKQSL